MSNIVVPYFKLSIKGKELDAYRMAMIQSIDFEDNTSGSDLLSITLCDPDLLVLEDDIFVEDVAVSFEGGIYKGATVKFEGYISIIDIDFPEDGTPVMTINCMDLSHKMNLQTKKRTWKNAKVSDVVSQIYKEYGLKVKVDATKEVKETISQNNTDIKFIVDLASNEYDEYITYIENRTGYFVKKPKVSEPQAQIDYRSGNGKMLSFSPRINKYSKQVEVQSKEVNLKDNKVDKATANNSLDRPISGTPPKPDTSTSGGSSSSGGGKEMIFTPQGKWEVAK